MAGTEIDNQDVAMRFAVTGLVLSGATNAVVGVLDAVAWAWWVAGACLLAALLAAGVWSGRMENAPRGGVVVGCGRSTAASVK
ncbi:MAG: hypothetical protein ABIQ18_02415 [Umezawaea sp.]